MEGIDPLYSIPKNLDCMKCSQLYQGLLFFPLSDVHVSWLWMIDPLRLVYF
jgi:hypothetical protein